MNALKKLKKILFLPRGNTVRGNDQTITLHVFFVQQCIEKYLKARLQEADIEFSKIHDLVKLLELVVPVEPLWDAYRPTFRYVSAYAVSFRYPGENAEKGEARDALKICRAFRGVVRVSLQLLSE